MKESDAMNEELLEAVKKELDASYRNFADSMAVRFYGSGPAPDFTPRVYTRRERLSFWWHDKTTALRERIALWIAPWLERDDSDY